MTVYVPQSPIDVNSYTSSRLGRLRLSAEQGVFQVATVLWRRKLLIAGMLAVSVAAAVGAKLVLPPKFTADGLVMIDTRQLTIPELQTAVSGLLVDASVSRSEARVLESWGLAEKVARTLHLDKDPDFNPNLTLEPGDEPLSEAEAWEAVVKTLTKGLSIRNDERSYAIQLAFEGKSPETSAAIVNTLMEIYVGDQIANKSDATRDANAWLTQRLKELEAEVNTADGRIQDFIKNHDLLETQLGTVSAQQLAELNTQLSLARAERAQTQANWQRARDLQSEQGSAAAAAEVLASPLIQKLRESEAALAQRDAELADRLGALHPDRRAIAQQLSDLRRKINLEISRVTRSLQDQVAAAKTREDALQQKLVELEINAGTSARDQVLLDQLRKEADAKRVIYQTFLARVEQTASPAAMHRADARIVSQAAVPTQPSSPRLSVLLAISVIGGTLFGAGLALLLAWFDDRFRTLDELSAQTGLIGLGAVPALRGRRARQYGVVRHVVENPYAGIAETLRGIRVRLRTVNHDGAPKVVLFTSAVPEEGKTSVAIAYARLAARDGAKVLLIDADLRRPQLAALLGNKKGIWLEDALSRPEDTGVTLGRDEETGLYILPVRGDHTNPAQILESVKFSALLAEAVRSFDQVVIDSPPVMRVADPIVLARLADAVVMVVAWKRTRRRVVLEALQRLESAGRPVLGAVLTRVRGRLPEEYVYGGYGNR
ncbi:MAG TPA: GNVR domain-containing protein [Azospirillaceae bacterium]|nr:GNVR domain-containing protein [Azospirillaceae bacterium]